MPSYDYICGHCEYQDEIFHMMSDESLQVCPHCNKPMNKQVGAGYVIVKNPDNTDSEMRDRSERAKERRSQPKQRSHSGKGSGRGKALGGQHFVNTAREDCGMEIVRWLESRATAELQKLLTCKFTVHSWNIPAGREMTERLTKLGLKATQTPFGM